MAGSHKGDDATETAAVPTAAGTDGQRAWLSPTRLAFGAVALAALGGGAWWRRRRRARVALQPMSDDWLREREYDAGQHSADD
jgi:uncharacterized protein YjiS (DUF1127 family)